MIYTNVVVFVAFLTKVLNNSEIILKFRNNSEIQSRLFNPKSQMKCSLAVFEFFTKDGYFKKNKLQYCSMILIKTNGD